MDGVFSGVRIIEFGMFVAGPYASELFAHGGADVIKVEPITGDATRFNSTIVPGEGRAYIIKARGKRGLPLNLRHEQRARDRAPAGAPERCADLQHAARTAQAAGTRLRVTQRREPADHRRRNFGDGPRRVHTATTPAQISRPRRPPG